MTHYFREVVIRDSVAVCEIVSNRVQVVHYGTDCDAWVSEEVGKVARCIDGAILPKKPFDPCGRYSAPLVIEIVGCVDGFYRRSPQQAWCVMASSFVARTSAAFCCSSPVRSRPTR